MTKEEKQKAINALKISAPIRTMTQEEFNDYIQTLNKIMDWLEREPRKGEWLRMSDLSEQEDDRYKCSRCGNVIHHKNKMNLYTFNSWCGRCGSDNGRKIEVTV